MGVRLQDAVRLTVFGQAEGQMVLNVWHVKMKGGQAEPPGGGLLMGVVEYWLSNTQTKILPGVSNKYELWGCVGETITGRGPIPEEGAKKRLLIVTERQEKFYSSPFKGALESAQPLNTFSAVGVRLITGLAGKSYRGSKRFYGIIESEVEGNKLDGTRLASFYTAVYQMTREFTVQQDVVTYIPCVFGAVQYKISPNAIAVPSDYCVGIQDVAVNPLATSQVSRKERATRGA